MKCIVAFGLFLAGCCSLLAQMNTWKALNGPTGITPSQATINHLGHLYVKHNKGLVRSIDEGKTWENLATPGSVEGLISLPDGAVLTMSSSKLYKIMPGATSWTPIGNVAVKTFTVNPQGHIFIIENTNMVQRSTDGGKTFVPFCDKSKFTGWPDALFFFGNGDNFVLSSYGAQDFLWRVSDNGSQVEKLTLPVNAYNPILLRHPSGKLFLWDEFKIPYYSTTGGKTWTRLTITSSSNSDTDLLYCAPSGLLYAEASGRLYVSSNEGLSWSDTKFLPPYNFFIAHAPDSKLSLIGGTCGSYYNDNSLFLSRDNWSTFEVLDDHFIFPDPWRIQKDGKGRLYVLSCSEYFVSEDDGQTWALASIDGGAPIKLLFTRNGHGFAQGKNGAWYISKDHGDSWEFSTSIFKDVQMLASIKEAPDGTLYGVGNYRIFKSVDFGESWSTVNNIFSIQNDFWIHPNGNFYSNDFGNPLVSTDEGMSWQPFQPAGIGTSNITGLHVTQQGLILFNANDFSTYTAYFSTDGGVTANVLPLPPGAKVSSQFYSNRAGDVFAVLGDSLYVTRDIGLNWRVISGALPTNGGMPYGFWGNLSAFYCDEENYIYLGFRGVPILKSQTPISYPNLIRGRAFLDSNTNCTLETGEIIRPFQLLKIEGSTEYYRVSRFDGTFVLDVPDGPYKISAVAPSPLWEACPPAVVNLVSGQADSARVDLGLKSLAYCANLQVSLSAAFLRRCFSNTYYVRVANQGNVTASGVELALDLDSFMLYKAANFPLRSQQGHTYTFAMGDLPAGAVRVLEVQFEISCDAELGQQHCVSVQATPLPDCSIALPQHYTAQECRPNQGSFDPNDKQAFARGLPLTDRVPPDTELEYLIRFQNTGTDTAFTVVVSDQLSPKLDLRSVRPGISSHPYRLEILEDRTLRFVFEHIALPDSSANEPASHGFVKFSVKPAANLPLGSKISNIANIYFDFNAPVRTNAVALSVELPTGVGEPASRLHCLVWPNPAREAFTVQWDSNASDRSGAFQLELFDATGRVALRRQVSGAQAQVMREGLPAGLYWLKITAPDGAFAGARVVLD